MKFFIDYCKSLPACVPGMVSSGNPFIKGSNHSTGGKTAPVQEQEGEKDSEVKEEKERKVEDIHPSAELKSEGIVVNSARVGDTDMEEESLFSSSSKDEEDNQQAYLELKEKGFTNTLDTYKPKSDENSSGDVDLRKVIKEQKQSDEKHKIQFKLGEKAEAKEEEIKGEKHGRADIEADLDEMDGDDVPEGEPSGDEKKGYKLGFDPIEFVYQKQGN